MRAVLITMTTYTEKRFFEWHEDEVSVTLRNKSGSYGGGSEVLIVQTVYDAHRDHDYVNFGETCATVYAQYGTGGGNVPIVLKRRFSDVSWNDTETSPTLEAGSGEGGNNLPIVLESNQNHATAKDTEVCTAIPASAGMGGGYVPMVVDTLCFDEAQITCPTCGSRPVWGDPCHTLSREAGRADVIIKPRSETQEYSVQRTWVYKESEQAHTLSARDYKSATDLVVKGDDTVDSVVRRLTPLECERLQGLPDNWTLIGEPDENGEYWYTDINGKRRRCADSARYKAIGNGIAVPFWRWLLKRISAQYERTPTLGSLFDGIGSFPLIWEGINGRGTAVWGSEIEPFPIEVTRRRFPDGT